MKILNMSNELTTVQKYKLTMNPATQKMATKKGQNLTVAAWCIYDDEKPGIPNPDTGEVTVKHEEILAIMDTNGDVFATNSGTFVRDFVAMWDLFTADGETVHEITVSGGKSKAGRDYITAIYAG